MKKDVLKLISRHIEKMDEVIPSSYSSPMEDKLLSLLNKRFFREYYKLTKTEYTAKPFLTILGEHNALYQGESVVNDFSYDIPDGYQEQHGYDSFDGELLKEIQVSHALLYEDVFDEVEDIEEVSFFDLFLGALEGAWNPTKMYQENENFQGFISDITTYFGDGDDYWTFISIPLTKETVPEEIREIFLSIENFSNNFDESSMVYEREGETVFAIWQGFNGYEMSNFCNWKFSFFFRLLYLDWYLREED